MTKKFPSDSKQTPLASEDTDFSEGWDLALELDRLLSEHQRWCEAKTPTASELELQRTRLRDLEKAIILTRQKLTPSKNLIVDRAAEIDLLASSSELIRAFGSFTGMNDRWFRSLTDRPALLQARKRKGIGGKRYQDALFCPYEVMCYLTTRRRRGTNNLSVETGWRLLASYFPLVYERHALADPRSTD